MNSLLSNVPAIIAAVVVAAFLVFAGLRLGARFLVRRVAGLIFVVLAATFIAFILNYLAPTTAIDTQLGDRATHAQKVRLEAFYGLDKPWYVQYGNFLLRLLHFNLGNSYVYRDRAVIDTITRQLPISMQLGIPSVVIAMLIGVSLGLVAAVRSGTRYDTAIQSTGLLLYSLPTFVLIPFYQVAMIQLQKAGIPHPPVASSNWDQLDAKIAPITILAIVQVAFYIRLTRTSMLEVLRQDYVRTARAKGLSERRVIWRHAFRNAVIPLLTAVGPALALIVNGAFITESLFNIPGIGFTAIAAVQQNDFPIISGTVIILALAVAMMNLVTDVAYGIVDPRIKTA